MVANKFELETALYAENNDINAGLLREDNPLDDSEGFRILCEASRRGDLKACQEQISAGVNINARDRYDYTPLISASLCGHYETVRLLLESGALCERDTFQGERCLYNALNDRIRDLLLSYNFAKSSDILQPLAAHVSLLRTKQDWPDTTDIVLHTSNGSYPMHKFLLAARSPFFAQKLKDAPEIKTWRISQPIPSLSADAVVKYLYLGEVSSDLGPEAAQNDTLAGIEWLAKHLQLGNLFDELLQSTDRRLARQIYTAQTAHARDQLARWFESNVLQQKQEIDSTQIHKIKRGQDSHTFADILLRADDNEASNGRIRSIIYPAHRAMLLRAGFFALMFESSFKESIMLADLHIVSIDCAPKVLEIVLTYLYTEQADFGLDVATDVLFAADLLMIDKLKQRAAVIISTLGSDAPAAHAAVPEYQDALDVYEVLRTGWDTHVHRLEEFAARYIAYRLEIFIDEPNFAKIVSESAARVKDRQAIDTIELIDE